MNLRYKILESACKHGITEDDILHAWENNIDLVIEKSNFPRLVYLCIGSDVSGNVIELLCEENEGVLIFFHALKPPTKKFLKKMKSLKRGR